MVLTFLEGMDLFVEALWMLLDRRGRKDRLVCK